MSFQPGAFNAEGFWFLILHYSKGPCETPTETPTKHGSLPRAQQQADCFNQRPHTSSAFFPIPSILHASHHFQYSWDTGTVGISVSLLQLPALLSFGMVTFTYLCLFVTNYQSHRKKSLLALQNSWIHRIHKTYSILPRIKLWQRFLAANLLDIHGMLKI